MFIQTVTIKISFILFFTKNSTAKTKLPFHAFFYKIIPIIPMLQPFLFPINQRAFFTHPVSHSAFYLFFVPLK